MRTSTQNDGCCVCNEKPVTNIVRERHRDLPNRKYCSRCFQFLYTLTCDQGDYKNYPSLGKLLDKIENEKETKIKETKL